MEIYQDEQCQELLGEANVIGASSFTRERVNINRAMIKRYIRSVAMRRGPTLPWFIPDPVARQYGISTALPEGIALEMKPPVDADGNFIVKQAKPYMAAGKPGEQMQIHEFFGGGSVQPEADPLPQFNFPCDDAQVPVELIDPEFKYPELKPVDQFIKDSKLLTRSLEIWSFFQTFGEQLTLSPFPYDDWEEAICCTDPSITKNPLLEETMLALLSTLMKDRRNMTKGAYSERIKQLVASFPLPAVVEKSETSESSSTSEASETSSKQQPEIAIYSDEGSDSDDNVPFYKRSRQSSITSSKVLLPAIDLRKHRWYETKAMDQWHFVLASCFMEIFEMLEAEIEVEEAKVQAAEEEEAEQREKEEKGEEQPDDGTEDEVYVESGHEMDVDDDRAKQTAVEAEEVIPETEKQNPKIQEAERLISAMLAFRDAYSPIIDELVEDGSRLLFTRFLELSLSQKFNLLEFLVHVHYDREAFTAYVEDCLERQPELRRLKREAEVEFNEIAVLVEEVEGRVAVLKAENAEIADRLAEDDEIELSSEEKNESESQNGSESEERKEDKAKPPAEPLTEKERQELTEKRAANRKEIKSLNANLRRIRPEYNGLKRKLEHFSTDLRQASSFRAAPLGEDRNGRVYWWFGDFAHPMSRILVESPAEGKWLGAIDSEASFDQLMAWLNALGIREAKLKSNLLDVEADLRQCLEERDDPNAIVEAADEADEEEVVVASKGKRGRGRPKGSAGRRNTDRPFQKYRNNM